MKKQFCLNTRLLFEQTPAAVLLAVSITGLLVEAHAVWWGLLAFALVSIGLMLLLCPLGYTFSEAGVRIHTVVRPVTLRWAWIACLEVHLSPHGGWFFWKDYVICLKEGSHLRLNRHRHGRIPKTRATEEWVRRFYRGRVEE